MKVIKKQIKEIFKIVKEYFILLLGLGLFTYGLFGFNSGYYGGKDIGRTIDTTHSVTTYYYYNNTSLSQLTTGIIFIAIGLLKIKRKKDEH